MVLHQNLKFFSGNFNAFITNVTTYISQRFLLLILAFTVYNVIFLNSTYVIVFITNETMSTYLVTLGYVTNFKMSCILT